jgi:hypothetical protein
VAAGTEQGVLSLRAEASPRQERDHHEAMKKIKTSYFLENLYEMRISKWFPKGEVLIFFMASW